MDILKRLRQEKGLTQSSVAEQLGVTQQAYANYESGKRQPDNTTLKKIADYFNVTVDYLLGREIPEPDFFRPVGDIVSVQVIASVRAGYDGKAVEDFDGETIGLPKEMLHGYSPEECRIFTVKGDSMYPRILEGDKIIVHVQPSVDSGDTAIVIYNNDEGTVKKVKYVSGEDWLELIPFNPEYQTHRIEGEDLNSCYVFGKVIGLLREFN